MVKGGRYSEWSSKFSLEALGSEGIFSCSFKDSSEEYQVLDTCSCIYSLIPRPFERVSASSQRPGNEQLLFWNEQLLSFSKSTVNFIPLV